MQLNPLDPLTFKLISEVFAFAFEDPNFIARVVRQWFCRAGVFKNLVQKHLNTVGAGETFQKWFP